MVINKIKTFIHKILDIFTLNKKTNTNNFNTADYDTYISKFNIENSNNLVRQPNIVNYFNSDISKWNILNLKKMADIPIIDYSILFSLYYSISSSKEDFSFDIFEHYSSFSYGTLVAAFFYNFQTYLDKFKEQCVPFELFNDISKNTDKFNVFLLVNNEYIIEEYLKLSIEEKEKLIQDETMNNFFNEIHSILNSQTF